MQDSVIRKGCEGIVKARFYAVSDRSGCTKIAVALIPATTCVPTENPISMQDFLVTRAVMGRASPTIMRMNGPKGTILVIAPVTWLRTLVWEGTISVSVGSPLQDG